MYTVIIKDASGNEVNKFTNVTSAQYDEVLEAVGALPKE